MPSTSLCHALAGSRAVPGRRVRVLPSHGVGRGATARLEPAAALFANGIHHKVSRAKRAAPSHFDRVRVLKEPQFVAGPNTIADALGNPIHIVTGELMRCLGRRFDLRSG